MIYGQEKSKVFKALDFISSSPFVFYLTGSRYFGTERPDSDYDFFTQENEQLEKVLEDNGFRLDSESYQGDPIMTKVYARENVHIQLVIDVKMKAWVQLLLASYIQKYKPDKEQLKSLWSIAIKLYRDGQYRPRESYPK